MLIKGFSSNKFTFKIKNKEQLAILDVLVIPNCTNMLKFEVFGKHACTKRYIPKNITL